MAKDPRIETGSRPRQLPPEAHSDALRKILFLRRRYSSKLSLGGMFVVTRDPRPVGSRWPSTSSWPTASASSTATATSPGCGSRKAAASGRPAWRCASSRSTKRPRAGAQGARGAGQGGRPALRGRPAAGRRGARLQGHGCFGVRAAGGAGSASWRSPLAAELRRGADPGHRPAALARRDRLRRAVGPEAARGAGRPARRRRSRAGGALGLRGAVRADLGALRRSRPVRRRPGRRPRRPPGRPDRPLRRRFSVPQGGRRIVGRPRLRLRGRPRAAGRRRRSPRPLRRATAAPPAARRRRLGAGGRVSRTPPSAAPKIRWSISIRPRRAALSSPIPRTTPCRLRPRKSRR